MTTKRIPAGSTVKFIFRVVEEDGTIVTLTGTDTLTVYFRDPDGTVTSYLAVDGVALSTDGTDGRLEWTCPDTFLTNALEGTWAREAKVVTVGGDVRTTLPVPFYVLATMGAA